MIDKINTLQCSGIIGVSSIDITPPVGIYHRMWGAAKHDQATGVHRPLILTSLWMQSDSSSPNQLEVCILLTLDHCILDGVEINAIRQKVAKECNVLPSQVQVSLSHTHGSGWMSRNRSHLPGGDLIPPYLDWLIDKCSEAASLAQKNSQPAFIIFGKGRCNLATHRDFYDEKSDQFVCGFNPEGFADDTLVVAKIENQAGVCLATLVNYACHPTTLAWENTQISPDYIGALRTTIETETNAPVVFVQGASGDLGPKIGFVGDLSVADRNGRQLGFATLSTLEALPPVSSQFTYAGPVVSGATLGIWKFFPITTEVAQQKKLWIEKDLTIPLPYRIDLPKLEETLKLLAHYEKQEALALQVKDDIKALEFRALVEQMNRQITRLSVLSGTDNYQYKIRLLLWGDSIWIFAPGELYQVFQVQLRNRFPKYSLVISTITNEWQPGYFPEASTYGYGIYQEKIATVAPGCLETLIEIVARGINQMLDGDKNL